MNNSQKCKTENGGPTFKRWKMEDLKLKMQDKDCNRLSPNYCWRQNDNICYQGAASYC